MNFNSFCIKNNSFKISRITTTTYHHLELIHLGSFSMFANQLLTSIVRHIVKPHKTWFNEDYDDSGINTPPTRFPLKLDGFKRVIPYDLIKPFITSDIPMDDINTQVNHFHWNLTGLWRKYNTSKYPITL